MSDDAEARKTRVSTNTVANLAAQHAVSSTAICEVVRSGRKWNEAII